MMCTASRLASAYLRHPPPRFLTAAWRSAPHRGRAPPPPPPPAAQNVGNHERATGMSSMGAGLTWLRHHCTLSAFLGLGCSLCLELFPPLCIQRSQAGSLLLSNTLSLSIQHIHSFWALSVCKRCCSLPLCHLSLHAWSQRDVNDTCCNNPPAIRL